MSTFQSNIINIYGEEGKAWLDSLPKLVAYLSAKLGLHDLQEVTNLTYSYVLSGFQGNLPIILKIGFDSEALAQEAFSLKCFKGCGAVNVLAKDKGFLLLERAVPGISLKECFPYREQESIEIACMVIKNLHQANIPTTHNSAHIREWLTALDKYWNIPNNYLQKAKELRDQLLQTSKPDVLLHGDLHHDNILQSGDAWVAIDPKGVIGEAAYEVAAFIRNPIPELLTHADAPNIIRNRIELFAKILGFPPQRILDWCFVQTVLAWVWAIEDSSSAALAKEDGCDASYFEQLTKVLDNSDVFSNKCVKNNLII